MQQKSINHCLGSQLLQARYVSGLTQKEITTKAGFSVSLLNKYETGDILPGLPNLMILSEILDSPIDGLLKKYHPDFIIYAIDSYLSRINAQQAKNILSEVENLIDGCKN